MDHLRAKIVVTTIAVIPLVLWLLDVGIDSVTSSWQFAIASLGKAAALSGFALYLVNPLLSMRHRVFEVLFGGLDALYVTHKRVGKWAFVLIFMHPVFLGLGRWLDGTSFTAIWNWASVLVLSGILAMIIFSALTLLAIYSHIRHQEWIKVHRVFGWLIPLFFIHGWLADNQLRNNLSLLVFFMVLAGVGFAAFLYRSVFSKYLVKRHRYEVVEVIPWLNGVNEVVLKPKGVPMSFRAGQFSFVSFEQPGIDPEAHPYSMSSAPDGPYIRFTIKALGDDSAKVAELKPGTKAYLEGPFGEFSYRRIANRKQVWIAGGVGITPFLSMARSFSGKKNYDIHFFYGCETEEEAVFAKEFEDIMMLLPEMFRAQIVAKDVTGFVSVELLREQLDDLAAYDYMICGPPGMMKALHEQLHEAGVPESQVHIEAFSM